MEKFMCMGKCSSTLGFQKTHLRLKFYVLQRCVFHMLVPICFRSRPEKYYSISTLIHVLDVLARTLRAAFLALELISFLNHTFIDGTVHFVVCSLVSLFIRSSVGGVKVKGKVGM